MAKPFTTFHVCRFLLFCGLGLAAVFGIFFLLTHATAREGITPASHSRSRPIALPAGIILNGQDSGSC